MAFGIARGGNSHLKVIVYVLDQFGGVLEPAFHGNEIGFSPWRVASQSDDIFDSSLIKPFQNGVNLLFGLADASQVGHNL